MRICSFFILAMLITSGCYRMPTEDDVSLVPITNNPNITHPSNMLIPGL